jgi:hypothetical protein
MVLPNEIVNLLRQGKFIAAEIPSQSSDFRAFVLVIPQVPDPYKHPEAWIHWGHRPIPNESGVIRIKDPSFITGYEIRYLQHLAKYSDQEWGLNYDNVLDDTTTRIKRIYVKREEEIEAALAQWLKDLSELKEPNHFDSSLVNSPIDAYLSRLDERPHLWL